ncbi:PREDICTED: galectin-6-like isoform X2 [Nicrophorus vespilloides]|uniref:Galectin n=1 Tax=Nicrophorus vespilloides TaxID=110193 RepID=A0ABM1MGS2_NICVS|nr:PREDICTED: galectin-6-like isoform X2 [Nicrophorus vespilloides]XP_017773771.1 PREDICTED: galectin-6-like isoform X2 [Nicrophorus vespilloides]XP_017773772.1 PREDICTED: galectin-6-like isoform X2 [Nicrophorus vespilloides]
MALIDDFVVIEQENHYKKDLSDIHLGSMIFLTGVTESKCVRFAVNFLTATGDIAFHFNPRLDRRIVVRNSRVEGSWDKEECTSMLKFGFSLNKPFSIGILLTTSEFMVSVDGKHHSAYAYRIPMNTITTLEVEGPVKINDCKIKTVKKYPDVPIHKLHHIAIDVDMSEEHKKHSIRTPFVGVLAHGFKTGWQLEIYGKIKILPQSFYINLQDGPQVWPHPEIPLHINPRFNSGVGGSNIFVRNAWHRGIWLKEERAPIFPFVPGSPFSLIIRMDRQGYSVWVDGKLTGEFVFQSLPVDMTIKCVYIQGDILLNHITMRRKITDTYFQHKKERCVNL